MPTCIRLRSDLWIERFDCSRRRASWGTPAMPLPDFTIRESPRAKNLRLRVTPEAGLSVIVPRGFDFKRLPGILKKKQIWIDDALAKAKARLRFFESKPIEHLPDRIDLRAIGEV